MEKRNSVLKNIGIVMGAWIKRYPIALLMIPIYLTARIIGPYLGTLLSSKVIGVITSGNVKQFFITIIGLLIATAVCGALENVIGSFLSAQRIYTRLGGFAADLFHKALTTDYQNVEMQKNLKIMNKAANSVAGNMYGPEELMNQTLNVLVVFLGIGTYGTMILMVDWKILVAVLVMFVGNVWLQTLAIKYGDKHREESTEIWREKNYIKKKGLNISAGKDIRIYQMHNWFHKLFCDIVKRRREYQKKVELMWYIPTIWDVIINFIRDFLAYSILIQRVLTGQIDVAAFTLYIGLVGNFSNWIYYLSGNLSAIKKASHEFNDYFEFMNLPEKSRLVKKAKTENKAKAAEKVLESGAESEEKEKNKLGEAPEIEFKDVGFTYDGTEKATLNGLNFTIHKGEKIALVGNNGAGKTTIVKLLTGLYAHTEGEILVNGTPLEQLELEEYQDNISVLFQDTEPMAFSLKENVASVESEKADGEKVWMALERAGLKEKVESLKNKENTFITQNLDEEGILLSGGETQKLLLAKAIYKNGNFLILDEPTSALDPIAESKIYEEYNELAAGKTAVFISHRLASTKFCDRIMFLDGGKIAEFGTHEELMKLDGKYKEMFDIQSQYYTK
ncbi:MAG: ABC transporter ATP-binding protein/permease [Treponema sp.]|nr:ABC transporter ATP-binding protein/permease [Treponema sp.]